MTFGGADLAQPDVGGVCVIDDVPLLEQRDRSSSALDSSSFARTKRVAALSNNDGCVIARSREAKALDTPVGIQSPRAVDDARWNCRRFIRKKRNAGRFLGTDRPAFARIVRATSTVALTHRAPRSEPDWVQKQIAPAISASIGSHP